MMKMQSLSQFQENFRGYLEADRLPGAPAGLYLPADYLMKLGGKRMRPVLALIGCGLYQDDTQRALPLAYAIELFHNFTLAHDDIMDAAPLRRGKPSVHAKYNVNQAILTGDVMLIHAYRYLCQTQRTEQLPAMLELFNRTAVEVCEGQQLDMEFETRTDVELPEYLKMIEWKTAVLLGCALQLGGMEGGAPHNDWAHLYALGINLGLAFQIQDDLLDAYGDPDKVGKKKGGDIIQGKKTYLVLRAYELIEAIERAELDRLLAIPILRKADEKHKLSAVMSLFDRYSIREEAARAQKAYEQKIGYHLDQIEVPDARKSAMRELIAYLVKREN